MSSPATTSLSAVQLGARPDGAARFSVSRALVDGQVLVCLQGRFTAACVPLLTACTDGLGRAADPGAPGPDVRAPVRRVVLDIAGVTFLDGAAVASLVESRESLTALGWHVVLGLPAGGTHTHGLFTAWARWVRWPLQDVEHQPPPTRAEPSSGSWTISDHVATG